MENINKQEFELFITSINTNAPIKDALYVLKYPYKPFCVMALFFDNDGINYDANYLYQKLKHSNSATICFKEFSKSSAQYWIVKKFYDLLVSDINVLEDIKKYTRKDVAENIEIGFNEFLYKKLVQLLFDQPFKWIKSEVFKCDIKNKTITVNKPVEIPLNEFYDIIKQQCFNTIKKCIPTYELKEFEFNMVLNYEEYELNHLSLFGADNNDVNLRKYQHLFAKAVKDRDQKCLICCEDMPFVLDACHLKEVKHCKSLIESSDPNNGITLCKNHHKLFDDNLISFDKNWNVIFSNQLDTNHQQAILKHQDCFKNIKSFKSNAIVNDYLEFRNNKIKNSKNIKWIEF